MLVAWISGFIGIKERFRTQKVQFQHSHFLEEFLSSSLPEQSCANQETLPLVALTHDLEFPLRLIVSIQAAGQITFALHHSGVISARHSQHCEAYCQIALEEHVLLYKNAEVNTPRCGGTRTYRLSGVKRVH